MGTRERILFLLDCGRRLRHADQRRGQLDEALNALLLLAYVAVRQGDAVGLTTCNRSDPLQPLGVTRT